VALGNVNGTIGPQTSVPMAVQTGSPPSGMVSVPGVAQNCAMYWPGGA
jgi:hypothetical protein